MQKTKNLNLKINGFTLIEMVVAVAVFLIISGVAVGMFLSVIQRQREVLAEQELLNQISYAQEYMSRALRMAKASSSNTDAGCIDLGAVYQLTQYDAGTESYKGIKFLNMTDAVYDGAERNAMCEEFYLDDATDPARPVLMMQKGTDSAVALTSPDLEIKSLKFSVNGYGGPFSDCPYVVVEDASCNAATNEDGIQPRVTILMNVEFAGQPEEIIQTSVSQRNLNVNVGAQPE